MAKSLKNISRHIIYDKEGQLCNRFWSYLSSIYWSIENNKKTYVIFWDPQIKYFDNLRHNNYISFPFNNWLWNLKTFSTYPTREIINHIYYSKVFHNFIESGKAAQYGFINGWETRNSDYCREMQSRNDITNAIKILFKPNENITNKVETTFNSEFKRQEETVVGIHIRRGDYKNWQEGKYFYSDDVYIKIMHHIEEIFPKVKFFCATNDPISPTIMKDFSPVYFSNATAAHDLYGLSLCDYIIGPPSTFSQWASFYGKVPLFLIESPNTLPQKKDFSCVYALDHFENGYIFHLDNNK